MRRAQKKTKKGYSIQVRLVIACAIWLLCSSATITIYAAYPVHATSHAPKPESDTPVLLNELRRTAHVAEENNGHPLTKDETLIFRLDELVIAQPNGNLLGLLNALHSVPFMYYLDQPGSGHLAPVASIVAGVFYEQRWDSHNYLQRIKRGAVINLTRAMAISYGPHKIRVNAVSPATVDTPMPRSRLKTSDKSWEEWKEFFAKQYPLRRIGQPIDVAYACLYLASGESSWVTGINLVLDGGFTAQ